MNYVLIYPKNKGEWAYLFLIAIHQLFLNNLAPLYVHMFNTVGVKKC